MKRARRIAIPLAVMLLPVLGNAVADGQTGGPCFGGTRAARVYDARNPAGARSPFDGRVGVRYIVSPAVSGALSDVPYPSASGVVSVALSNGTSVAIPGSSGASASFAPSGTPWRVVRGPSGDLYLEVFASSGALPSSIRSSVLDRCPADSPATTFTFSVGGTTTTSPTTTSTTTVSSGSLLTGDIDWVIERKLRDDDGVLTYEKAVEIPPTRITLSSPACTATSRVAWTVTGSAAATTTGCTLTRTLPEGVFTVTARIDGTSTVFERDVVIQNFIIASIGDSNGSGEGNPVAGQWSNADCHRSRRAGSARAAQLVEDDPVLKDRSVVTLIHLACSGARIDRGLLDAYEGMDTNDSKTEAPQLQQLQQILRDPKAPASQLEIDAVITSVGINNMGDKGFSQIIAGCLLRPRCDTAGIIGESPSDMFERNRADLQVHYFRLSRCLTGDPSRCERSDLAVSIVPNRVLVTEYADLSSGDGKVCTLEVSTAERASAVSLISAFGGPFLIAVGGIAGLASMVLGISAEEFAWFRKAGNELNGDLRQHAGTARYSYVDGIASKFVNHGYCATRDRFIVQLLESINNQGTVDGSFHPNAAGHAITAAAVKGVLDGQLRAGDLPRTPAGAPTPRPETVKKAAT